MTFLSPGDMLPLPDNWVCTDRLASGIGYRVGRPVERGGPELPLPPVADRVRRLVLEAFRLIGNSEKNPASLFAISSASYSAWYGFGILATFFMYMNSVSDVPVLRVLRWSA